eukprot:scaffold32150_cov64-Attheya_sp.AAC.1
MGKCEYRLYNNHLGGKSSLTTQIYNLNVNHICKIFILQEVGQEVKYHQGSYIIVDDGYLLTWSTTVPPHKVTGNKTTETRW